MEQTTTEVKNIYRTFQTYIDEVRIMMVYQKRYFDAKGTPFAKGFLISAKEQEMKVRDMTNKMQDYFYRHNDLINPHSDNSR